MAQDQDNTSGETGGQSTSGLVTEQVKTQAQDALQTTQQTAGQVADRAKEQARSMADTQKAKAADSLDAVAQAVRDVGQELQSKQESGLAQVAESGADKIGQLSTYLRQNDVSNMVGSVETYGRQSPAIFLGAAFALGLLAARFLKSSAPSGTSYVGSNRAGGSSSSRSGMPSGQFSYTQVAQQYEDVSGTPPVELGYAPGLMGESGTRAGDTASASDSGVMESGNGA